MHGCRQLLSNCSDKTTAAGNPGGGSRITTDTSERQTFITVIPSAVQQDTFYLVMPKPKKLAEGGYKSYSARFVQGLGAC